jgi:vancomycin resistance protein YoaR
MNLPQLTTRQLQLAATTGVGLLIVLFLAFWVMYSGKVLPGVYANGIYIGGLSKSAAEQELSKQATAYNGQQIPVSYGNTTLRIPVSGLAPSYSQDSATAAMHYGRTGALTVQIRSHLRALFGHTTSVTSYHYKNESLTPFIQQVENDATAPVANAQLSFADEDITITPAQPGKRVDQGRLVAAIEQRLAQMSADAIAAPVYDLTPTVSETALEGAKGTAKTFVSAPLKLELPGQIQTVDEAKILSWVNVTTGSVQSDMITDPLLDFYTQPVATNINLKLDDKRVGAYVAQLATKVNRAARDAVLTVVDGKVAAAIPSQDGLEIDQTKTVSQIIDALGHDQGSRDLTLASKQTKATVNENNLPALGITDLIGEGQSFFPGSSSARLVNVRVAQSVYNNLLIKPGETFSFGQKLGDVGPAQGYQPSLVIIGNKEEKQYGGGICQVSSTMYRAALTAGLPIVQRTNHSFAINEFYTQPYPAPGVDATIYYPQVDLKFRNDTPGYILVQTKMVGSALTFDMYGTKTKSGVIRGPYFVSGDADATKPSHTVFYRDVLDMTGKVVKTDTTDTYYKASTDFTIVDNKQFN